MTIFFFFNHFNYKKQANDYYTPSNKTQNIIFVQLKLQILYIPSLTYQNIKFTQMTIFLIFNYKKRTNDYNTLPLIGFKISYLSNLNYKYHTNLSKYHITPNNYFNQFNIKNTKLYPIPPWFCHPIFVHIYRPTSTIFSKANKTKTNIHHKL